MKDRHIETIEKSIIANENHKHYLSYVFEDGTRILGFLDHDYEMKLVKEHGCIVEIKRKDSV